MKKSTFDNRPELLAQEGSQMRINFDVESVQETIPSMDGGEDVTREVFKANVVRVAIPFGVESVKAALIAHGFNEFKSEAVACEAVFVNGGSTDIDVAKQMMTARISEYDSSPAVNEFTLNGMSMWLDDATRTKLAKRFDTDEQDGLTETKLIYDGVSFDLPISMAKAMLHQIESYARDCFDKTNEHKAAVASKKKVDTVLSYDYTVGYPQKLEFTLSE